MARLRVIAIDMHLIAHDGHEVDVTEYTPWSDRAGLWEADKRIEHDGSLYAYVGCDHGMYQYREVGDSRIGARDLSFA